MARSESPELIQFPVQRAEWFAIRDWALEQQFWIMTFIIEATKDDHHTVDIRSTAIVAVILARKLAADGYEVSIRSPTGRLYSADQFNHLLTSKSLNSEGVADDG